MADVDDQGNVTFGDEQPITPAAMGDRRRRSYKVIIFRAHEDRPEELENRIEAFLNLPPKKELVSVNFSSQGINHFVLIIYREGR